nr:uncharacterized protein LOC109189836 [Ipomoea batatas]
MGSNSNIRTGRDSFSSIGYFIMGRCLSLASETAECMKDTLKVARFWEALGADFTLGPDRSWGDVHLHFFLILQLNHFYLLRVDFKTERLEIIDSSASTEATRVKYGDTPENVEKDFTFLSRKDMWP